MDGIKRFNAIINDRLIENGGYLKNRLTYLPRFARIGSKLKKQERIRSKLFLEEGITVPPILILSVTEECNLSCRGCYSCALGRAGRDDMSLSDVERILGQAIETGVGIVFLAGGEPLMKEGLLDLVEFFVDTLFVMFTNGLLLNDSVRGRMKKIKNLVPAISLEGNEATTDERRGEGVYQNVRDVMAAMDRDGCLFGASLTLTRNNYEEVTRPSYLEDLEKSGCRTLFLIEYVPCEGDPHLCLTEAQKEDLLSLMDQMHGTYSFLPVALPGDEAKFGGCLAAGRGFLHVSSRGTVEACPFAPFSDVNLREVSFREALASRLMKNIRDNHHLLEEAEGGCSLFENSEWVARLASE